MSYKITNGDVPLIGLVHKIAKTELARSGSPVDYNDVVAEGMLGLVKATRDYKKGKGAKKSTYANLRIRGHVLDIIRREANKLSNVDFVDPQTFVPAIDPAPPPDTAIDNSKIAKALRASMELLKPKEQLILHRLYFLGSSESQIAKDLDMPLDELREVVRYALRCVRTNLAARGYNGTH